MNAARPNRQLLLDVRPQQIPTLDNFVVGSNAELLTALHALTAQRDSARLYLWGPAGSGRSHLLRALASNCFFHGSDLPADLAPPQNSLIVVDDVETLSPEAQIALFRLFNDAPRMNYRLLLSGATAPLHLQLRDDLRTRIGQCLIYEVKPLTEAEKASALLYHAAQRGMRVDDHIIEYLLRHGRRDLPSLLAVLDALDSLSLEQQRPVTLPLLRDILQSN